MVLKLHKYTLHIRSHFNRMTIFFHRKKEILGFVVRATTLVISISHFHGFNRQDGDLVFHTE